MTMLAQTQDFHNSPTPVQHIKSEFYHISCLHLDQTQKGETTVAINVNLGKEHFLGNLHPNNHPFQLNTPVYFSTASS